jgi:hypothetical protein
MEALDRRAGKGRTSRELSSGRRELERLPIGESRFMVYPEDIGKEYLQAMMIQKFREAKLHSLHLSR